MTTELDDLELGGRACVSLTVQGGHLRSPEPAVALAGYFALIISNAKGRRIERTNELRDALIVRACRRGLPQSAYADFVARFGQAAGDRCWQIACDSYDWHHSPEQFSGGKPHWVVEYDGPIIIEHERGR